MRPATANALSTIKSAFYPTYVKYVYIFGSEVYGVPHPRSDIDIGIISERPLKLLEKVHMDELFENLMLPYEYQLVFATTGKYSHFDIRRNIFEKGLLLYENKNVQ